MKTVNHTDSGFAIICFVHSAAFKILTIPASVINESPSQARPAANNSNPKDWLIIEQVTITNWCQVLCFATGFVSLPCTYSIIYLKKKISALLRHTVKQALIAFTAEFLLHLIPESKYTAAVVRDFLEGNELSNEWQSSWVSLSLHCPFPSNLGREEWKHYTFLLSCKLLARMVSQRCRIEPLHIYTAPAFRVPDSPTYLLL